jgi:peptidoglycan LD-endopeptidase CwlK
MTYRFSYASKLRLYAVHPDLVRVAQRALLISPHDFAITEGIRTIERQTELKAKGFSHTLDSKHLMQSDGWAHAIDVVAVGDLNGDGHVDHRDLALEWDRGVYTEIAEAFQQASAELGIAIRWGGAFHDFFDGPHFELVTPA